MTKLLEQALREVEKLPAGEQDAAAGALMDYLAHRHDLSLTDAQIAEVRRRRAEPERRLTADEARERVRRFGA
jgi:hypothetical protein